MLNNKCKVYLTIKFDDKDVLWRLTEGDLYKIEQFFKIEKPDGLGDIFDIMVSVKKQSEGGFEIDYYDDMYLDVEFEIDWYLIVKILNNRMHLILSSGNDKINADIINLYRQPIMDKIVDPLFKRLNGLFKLAGNFRPIIIPSYKKDIEIRLYQYDFSSERCKGEKGEIGYIFNIKILAVAHSSGDENV